MSGRKNGLLKFKAISAGAMANTDTLTSAVSNIEYLDNVGIQFVFTGTPTGTFYVDVSIDHAQDQNGNVSVAGTWTPVTLPSSPVASGAAGNVFIDLNQLSAPWVRFRYVNTSGSGTLDAYLCGKML